MLFQCNQAYKIKVLRVPKINLEAHYSVAEGVEAQITSRLLQACGVQLAAQCTCMVSWYNASHASCFSSEAIQRVDIVIMTYMYIYNVHVVNGWKMLHVDICTP